MVRAADLTEREVREKEDEAAELRALELQTRELAGMFDGLKQDFGRINSSMADSSKMLANWKEVSRLMALPDESSQLFRVTK